MIRCSQSSFTILSLNDWGLKVVEVEIWHDVTGVPKKYYSGLIHNTLQTSGAVIPQ